LLIEEMRESGVIFDNKLSAYEIKLIENDGKFRFPDDLKTFLQIGMPISMPVLNGMLFPNWHTDGAQIVLKNQQQLLSEILLRVDQFYIDFEYRDQTT
jgi:hypothetical protein